MVETNNAPVSALAVLTFLPTLRIAPLAVTSLDIFLIHLFNSHMLLVQGNKVISRVNPGKKESENDHPNN
jgi:hypothetical protein